MRIKNIFLKKCGLNPPLLYFLQDFHLVLGKFLWIFIDKLQQVVPDRASVAD